MARLSVEDLRALTSLSADRKTINEFLMKAEEGRGGRSYNRYVTISIDYDEDVDEFFKTHAARTVKARNTGDARAGNKLMRHLRSEGPGVWAAQSPIRKEHHVNMAYARINPKEEFEMHVLSVPISKEYHAYDNVKVFYTTLGFLLDSKWYFDPLNKALDHIQSQERKLLEKVAAEINHRSSFGGFNFAGVTKEILIRAVVRSRPWNRCSRPVPSFVPEEFSFNHTPMKKHIGARDALRSSRCIWTTKPDCRRR